MRAISLLLGALLAGALFLSSAFADDATLGDQLGTIHFEAGGLPAAQPHVVRGVKLLHHMMYPEADRAFVAALAADRLRPRLVGSRHDDHPSAVARCPHRGRKPAGRGVYPARPRRRLGHAARAGLPETLDVYFRRAAAAEYPARLKELDRAWSALADRYPDDLDALAFSALYHLARLLHAEGPVESHPARSGHPPANDPGENSRPSRTRSNYKIHAYDFPLLADRALEVCGTYGGIAPDMPHALHMPTHIYTRRGMWDQSIEYNLRSAAAASASPRRRARSTATSLMRSTTSSTPTCKPGDTGKPTRSAGSSRT